MLCAINASNAITCHRIVSKTGIDERRAADTKQFLKMNWRCWIFFCFYFTSKMFFNSAQCAFIIDYSFGFRPRQEKKKETFLSLSIILLPQSWKNESTHFCSQFDPYCANFQHHSQNFKRLWWRRHLDAQHLNEGTRYRHVITALLSNKTQWGILTIFGS